MDNLTLEIDQVTYPVLRKLSTTLCRILLSTVLNKRLVHWLKRSHIIPENLFGFRPSRNSIGAVTNFVLDVHQAFTAKEITVFLDIQSTYDNVNLPILQGIL